MSALPLVYYGSEILTGIALPVPKVSSEIKKLVDEMFETMRLNNGVGLAAPQVGVNKRVIVIDVSHIGVEPFALVNPVILKQSGSAEDSEGCLSLPGIFLPVVRSEKITVRGRDIKGRSITIQADGFLARVLQHEIDHLEGKVFVDRIEDRDSVNKEVEALKVRLAQFALTGKWEDADE